MPTPTGPPELPTELLTDPAMIEACAARNFDVIFRLVRTRASVYPSQVARRCELTQSRVGEIIRGKRKVRDIQVIERIADGLRIPGNMLGLAARPWETRPALAPSSPPVEAHSVAPIPPVAGAVEHDASLPSSDLDDILALAATPRISPSTLRALQASIEDYWRRDDQHGGGPLRPAVIGHLRYVSGLLQDESDPALRPGLHAIGAELARLAGWTYFDARQYSTARTYFSQALRLAKAIDDQPFIANVLACLSLQATYQDRPRDAVALSQAAQDSARQERSTPRVMAMLSMREAFAHATIGDKPATHAAIDEAHRTFALAADGDEDPAWVRYFDRTKLTVDTGIALGQLGDARAAEPLIAHALLDEDDSNQRGRAFHSFWLARVRLQRRAVEEACVTAGDALTLAASVDSPRLTEHLREFRRDLAAFGPNPAAIGFESRLRETFG